MGTTETDVCSEYQVALEKNTLIEGKGPPSTSVVCVPSETQDGDSTKGRTEKISSSGTGQLDWKLPHPPSGKATLLCWPFPALLMSPSKEICFTDSPAPCWAVFCPVLHHPLGI